MCTVSEQTKTKTTRQPVKASPVDVVAAARERVVVQRRTRADLASGIVSAEAALEELDARSAAVVLDDPSSAVSLAVELAQRRDQLRLLRGAVSKQDERVAAAEREYLLAEAAVLEPAVARAQAVLDRHEARTAELLRLLEEHDGPYVPEIDLVLATWDPTPGVPSSVTYTAPKSRALVEAVEAARLPIRILAVLADGGDPGSLSELAGQVDEAAYPACVWGPAALVPAPAWVGKVAAVERELESARAAVEANARQVVDLEEAIERGDPDPGGALEGVGMAIVPSFSAKLARSRVALTAAKERLAAAEVAVDALASAGGGS